MKLNNRLLVENLNFTYGKKEILKNISFSCQDGITALLGNNGVGKTTLMQIISGLKKASSGQITLNGTDLLNTDSYPINKVGYLPQRFDVYNNVTGYDLLSYIFDLKGLTDNKKQTIAEVIEQFQLDSVIYKRIGKYSGGFKRRLGIAQAVLGKPDLIIIDEPTVGLDPEQRVEFRSYLSEISKDCITLISTHIIEDIELYSDQIIILKNKMVAFNGSIEEIISNSTPYIASFETDLASFNKLKENLTIIEEKRINNSKVKIKYIKNKNIHDGIEKSDSLNDKEITLENAYIYFQKK